MLLKIIKRLQRAPVAAMAVLLFAAVISIIICGLQASNEAEVRNYEEVYRSVPIKVTVTNISGTDSDDLNAEAWLRNIFTGEQYSPASLKEYVKDVQLKMKHWITAINTIEVNNAGGNYYLIGMTSLSCDKRLLPENKCQITWYEGYDESIFAGDEQVCIIPEGKAEFYSNESGEVVLNFSRRTMGSIKGETVEKANYEYECTLKIVGTYTAGDGKSIYCPYPLLKPVYSTLEEKVRIDSLSATLADNSRLDEFREAMVFWFVEPSPGAEEIPWGRMGYDYYPYALDIDDKNLLDLSAILKDSIKFNQTVTIFVVILSVVAGFLIGFLMIRRRKRDIMLMRTVGESNFRVYLGFVIEQMICIVLGVVVGGAYYKWDPIKNLAIFAVVYFIGLSLALAIFMSKKLIKNIKEDE